MFKLKFKKLGKLAITRNQGGFTLVEVVIAIMLLGLIGAALFNGLGTASKVLLRNDIRQTAKNLAETHMEWVKNQLFTPGVATYTPPATLLNGQPGFSATISVVDGSNTTFFGPSASENRDSRLQKITVNIYKSAVLIYTLEGYKVQ